MSGLSAQRLLLERKIARLSETECREVCEYVEAMRSLRHGAARRNLFGEGFALRCPAQAFDEGRLRRARRASQT